MTDTTTPLSLICWGGDRTRGRKRVDIISFCVGKWATQPFHRSNRAATGLIHCAGEVLGKAEMEQSSKGWLLKAILPEETLGLPQLLPS